MEVMYEHCAGLDVHKKTVVACVLTPAGQETRTFGMMAAALLTLADWLLASGCTHVTMESTGDYWKSVFNMLEGTCEVLLVNAQHVKAVPGRKADVEGAAWLAELLQHGLLRAGFIPPLAQRELRDLTRYRSTFIRQRVALINRHRLRLFRPAAARRHRSTARQTPGKSWLSGAPAEPLNRRDGLTTTVIFTSVSKVAKSSHQLRTA
jgi:transposase